MPLPFLYSNNQSWENLLREVLSSLVAPCSSDARGSVLASSQTEAPRRDFLLQRTARGPGDTSALLTDEQAWMTLSCDYSCLVMVFFGI